MIWILILFVQIRITILQFLVFMTRFLSERVMLPLCSRELARAVMNARASSRLHEYLSMTVIFQLDWVVVGSHSGKIRVDSPGKFSIHRRDAEHAENQLKK
jgi:hypothetical protein